MFFDDILIISIIFIDFLTISQFMCNVISSTNVIFGMGISPPPFGVFRCFREEKL